MSRQRHPKTGKFTDSWFLQETPSDGGPQAKLFLPSLPSPWKIRWYRKGRRLYADAERSGPKGKRIRLCRRLDTIVEAVLAKEAEYQEHGQLAGALTTAQRWEAARAFLICERLGVDLIEVVTRFEKNHPKSGMARTLDQVRIEIVAKKVRGERRKQYIEGLDYKIRCLIKAFGNVAISSITKPMIEKYIARDDWASGTVHGTVTSLKVLFNFARVQGYIIESPCNNLELPRHRTSKPEILTVNQVRVLLAGCRTNPEMEQCTAYVAIGLFTGIRPQEMQRMTWEMVNLDAGLITIEGADAKCGERGIVTISPNLSSWLRPIAKKTGRILEAPIEKLRILCRSWLGLNRWPHDCLRHSFGSYHYTEHRDIGEVCAMMRHGTGPLVFINRYYVVVTPAEAHAFWAIVRPVALLTL